MQDKNTSARLCAKNADGGGGAYLRDTTVYTSSLSVLLSALEMSYSTQTALALARWPLAKNICIHARTSRGYYSSVVFISALKYIYMDNSFVGDGPLHSVDLTNKSTAFGL